MQLQRVKKYFPILLLFFFSFFAHAEAATLYFSPSSGSQTAGNIMNVNVLVNTQGQAINSADVTISYPTNFLEVVSVSKSGSIFSLWVEEPTFSNGTGVINLSGGLPTPGYNGAAGKIIGITFRLKTAGSASLIFSSGAVRANDGLGTNVLTASNTANFSISAPVRVEPAPEPEKPKPVPVVAPKPVKKPALEPEPVVELPEPAELSTFNFKTLLTPLALAIVVILILLIALIYGRRRFVYLRREVRRETRDMEKMLHRSLNIVKDDVKACVSLLEKTRARRRLTEEEREVAILLRRHVQETEKLVIKELQDICRRIKD